MVQNVGYSTNCMGCVWPAFDFTFDAKANIILACEQALLGVGGGRGKEERACNDVSGFFISTSLVDIEFGAYVIALRVHRVDNTKMVESGVSIREGCENFSK